MKDNSFIKYSTIAFSMISTIIICAYIGNWIDSKFENKTKLITLIFMLFGIFASIYLLFRQLKNDK